MTAAECNYGVGDKEPLAIMVLLEKWQLYLLSVPRSFVILTDYHNLQSFGSKALLSRRQSCWAQRLAEFNYKIMYHPSKQNGRADALS